MPIIQIGLLLFVGFALLKTAGRFRARQIMLSQMLFWCALWMAVAAAAIFPRWTVSLANIFGVGRGTDFVLYAAVAFLLYAVFRFSVRLQGIEKNITKLVRERALKDVRK